MVNMLNRKMFRDIMKNLSQFITIFLMILIGVITYSGIEAYMDGMTKTGENFYSNNNLQDLNILGVNFTNVDLEVIKRIDNVKDAERKLSVTAVSGDDRTLSLNFIESNNISKFHVIDGEEFDVNKSGIWLDSYYAIENGIKVGDIISIKYEGLKLEEKVLALINVPDHLYDTRDKSELYPDRKKFGFAYLSTNEITEEYIRGRVMRELNIDNEERFNLSVRDFNYKNYLPFNTIMVDIDDRNRIHQVKDDVENLVNNAMAVVDIKDTISYSAYQGEIDEGKTYVGVFSGLFLFIAMLSVITTMTRVVKNQRIQIGTLKSLGFSNTKILFHYIGYGFWIALIAAICGLILGYYILANLFISLEMAVFEIPNGQPVMSNKSYIVACFVILLVVIITYFTVRNILKESPAETLRNKIPSFNKNSLNVTTNSIFRRLSFSSKWNLRDIFRNKMRTTMGIVGVVGCCMLLVCALGMLDSMNYFINLQFEGLYNFNYKLDLKENLSRSDLVALEKEYGNMTSKTYGIEIKAGDRRESNNIFVTDAGDFVRFVDSRDNFIKLDSDNGIYVTYKLASNNGYKLGDEVTWRFYGDSKYYTSKIVGFNRDPQNQNITMTRKYLESLGIEYKPDTIYSRDDLSGVRELSQHIETLKNVGNLKEGMNNMLSMMKKMLVLIITIAILLGVVIIYNLGILSYTEKEYQFATLKVLGFRDEQIEGIFVKQNNWIALVSVVIGLPLGYCLTDWLFRTAIEENYDFRANITIWTYAISAIGTFVISFLVSKYLSKKIRGIDMVSSLKGNE